ncbi:hypothetical protein D3C76_1610620 [compost metagenome]
MPEKSLQVMLGEIRAVPFDGFGLRLFGDMVAESGVGPLDHAFAVSDGNADVNGGDGVGRSRCGAAIQVQAGDDQENQIHDRG